MACDVCGKVGTDLEPLLDVYKTPDIQHVCVPCRKIIEDNLRKTRNLTHNILVDLTKRSIAQLKERLWKK